MNLHVVLRQGLSWFSLHVSKLSTRAAITETDRFILVSTGNPDSQSLSYLTKMTQVQNTTIPGLSLQLHQRNTARWFSHAYQKL